MFDYAVYLRALEEGQTSLNPFLRFMGIRLEAFGQGTARFRMPVREDFLQGAGAMQGGLIVAMADEAIAHAMMTLLRQGEGLTTVTLTNDFLAAVREGDLVAEARVFKKGRTVMVGDCIVRDGRGRDVSRTSATFLVIGADAASGRSGRVEEAPSTE